MLKSRSYMWPQISKETIPAIQLSLAKMYIGKHIQILVLLSAVYAA